VKIGLTMRHSHARDYPERRDAIARDWPLFLQKYMPTVQWMLLPNLPARDMVAYAIQWELGGFLLTGGDDAGTDSLRDEAETALLDYAVSSGKPVLGICRGFQMIQKYLGGAVAACDADSHVSRTHEVHFAPWLRSVFPDLANARVNSYHGKGIRTINLASPLKPVAVIDEWVECAVSENPALMGMLWHPERVGGNPVLDGELMERFFTGKIGMAVT
jgi:putative glutamine amidotransferase